jgi:hypothetical protein
MVKRRSLANAEINITELHQVPAWEPHRNRNFLIFTV